MPDARPSSRGALLVAILVYWVVHTFVPFGTTLLYPLTLLATWVHEMGHGVTALVVGGSFGSLSIFADASGLAYTAAPLPWQRGLVAAGGLLAPPVVGAALLVVSRGPRRARIVLGALAVAMLTSLAIWVRSAAGWIAVPLDAAAVLAFAIWGGQRERMVFARLVGVALAIDTWSRKGYLFSATATVDGAERPSDIASVAGAFGGPYIVWGLAIFVVSCALLAAGLFRAWQRQEPSARVTRS
jgi:hypothetical protein